MKVIARCPIEVVGYGIVRRGGEIDLPDHMVDERIAANFVRADGKPIGEVKKVAAPSADERAANDADAAIAKTVSVMGRDGMMRKLDELGIPYSPKNKNEYLAKLILRAQGEIE